MLCLETGIKGRDKWLHTTDVVGYKHLFMPLIPGSGTTILIYSTAHTTRHLNLQWSSDTIWRHRSGSMRALAMAWCLTTHHQRAISQEMFMNLICNMCLENALLKLLPHIQRDTRLNPLHRECHRGHCEFCGGFCWNCIWFSACSFFPLVLNLSWFLEDRLEKKILRWSVNLVIQIPNSICTLSLKSNYLTQIQHQCLSHKYAIDPFPV